MGRPLASSGLSGVMGTVAVALQDANPVGNPTSLGRRLVTVTVHGQRPPKGPVHEPGRCHYRLSWRLE